MLPRVHDRPPGLRRLLAVAAATLVAAAPGPPRPSPPPVLGFAINAHHIGDLSLYLESVDAIAALGANALVLVTPMFQQRVDSSEIRFLEDRCPTDEQLLAILDRARRRGLRTTLLPIVLIEQPGEKDWRGVIRPADPDAWWASYERFLDRFVRLARRGGADALSIGSELNSTEGDVERWRLLIERVRGVFGGRITYTANWDRYERVAFWDEVDFMSVSAYFELAPSDADAPEPALRRAWRVERDRLTAFARRRGKRVLLMEVGYPSLPWAAAHPWDYVARDGMQADHEAQARCWRAFFEAWTDAWKGPDATALGFHCYLWDPYHRGGNGDTGYGIRGKPAQAVIQDAFARIAARAAARRPSQDGLAR